MEGIDFEYLMATYHWGVSADEAGRKYDEEVIRTLDGIEETHGISYKIRLLGYDRQYNMEFPPELRALISKRNPELKIESPTDIYSEEFVPRKIVMARRGRRVSHYLRTRRGNWTRNHLLVLKKRGDVEYYWMGMSYSPRKEEDEIISYLGELAERGEGSLRDLLHELKQRDSEGGRERRMIDTFIDSGKLKGHFRKEVSLGKGPFSTAIIDLICEEEESDAVWVIEAKTRLNYEALGQVIVYSHLFKSDNPSAHIKRGIVCEWSRQAIYDACKKDGIEVFIVGATKTH